MSLYLQDYLHSGSATLIPSATVFCRCCGRSYPITGAEGIDAAELVTETDIQESLSAAMAAKGWENKNCPDCVATKPDLCKEDEA